MKLKNLFFLILLIIPNFACNLSNQIPTAFPSAVTEHTATTILPSETLTQTLTVASTFTLLPTDTALPSTPTEAPTSIPVPTVPSLRATVTADRLSCRYGPGPEYLYLFALRQTANIKLIGRVDAENWDWFMVENQVNCWVKAEFLDIQGEPLSLPIVYPNEAKLPVTPYYPPSEVLRAERDNITHEVTVSWVEVPVSLGDYEDDSMQTYIIEVWRCEGGQLIFDPLATRFTAIKFMDEPGCAELSHGRVFVQEKHGYAGPAEIPWPLP